MPIEAKVEGRARIDGGPIYDEEESDPSEDLIWRKTMGMTPRERFLVALKGGQPDRVPIFDCLFSKDVYEYAIGKRPEVYNGSDAAEASLALGFDAAFVFESGGSGLHPEKLTTDTYRCEWGITWKVDPPGWPADGPIDHPIKNRKDFENYVPPDPLAPKRVEDVEMAVEKVKGKIAIVAAIPGPFTQAWLLTGFERFALAMYDDPDLIHSLLKMTTDYAIKLGKRMIAGGADVIMPCDDIGTKTGPFISPKQFETFIFLHFKRLVGTVKELGVPVLFHCCGNIDVILDKFVEIGMDGYNPVQRSAGMNLRKVKTKYGERICLSGNVNSSVTLPYGTEEDVERETKECLREGAPRGGYILSSDHSFHGGIPINNILKMIEVGKKYGKYPLKEELLRT